MTNNNSTDTVEIEIPQPAPWYALLQRLAYQPKHARKENKQ